MGKISISMNMNMFPLSIVLHLMIALNNHYVLGQQGDNYNVSI